MGLKKIIGKMKHSRGSQGDSVTIQRVKEESNDVALDHSPGGSRVKIEQIKGALPPQTL